MPKYIPQSIEDEGLEPYLNRTAALHNGLGYDDFGNRYILGVPRTKIADDFGVNEKTIDKYKRIYDKEKSAREEAGV